MCLIPTADLLHKCTLIILFGSGYNRFQYDFKNILFLNSIRRAHVTASATIKLDLWLMYFIAGSSINADFKIFIERNHQCRREIWCLTIADASGHEFESS